MQVGSNVVATGSGPIDLTGLSFRTNIAARLVLIPSAAFVFTGRQASDAEYDGITGPTNFGSGGATLADSGGGDFVGVDGFGPVGIPAIFVPVGYASDSPLSDSATYTGQTFMSLGATPGTYKWTWGTGANQNFTLVIGAAVPEPSTWAMMLIGFAGLGFMGMQSAGRRRRTACNA
jgi:hypothetical protein